MLGSSAWDAATAVQNIYGQAREWQGSVWRSHDRAYAATDAGGSVLVPGRYHRDWPTLYTALTKAIALGERQRHLTEHSLRRLATLRLSRLRVRLSVVLDIRDPAAVRVELEDLIGDDFDRTQDIGLAAASRRVQGLLVPTATGLDMSTGGTW